MLQSARQLLCTSKRRFGSSYGTTTVHRLFRLDKIRTLDNAYSLFRSRKLRKIKLLMTARKKKMNDSAALLHKMFAMQFYFKIVI